MILGCWFSCFFDVAELCFVLFYMLFPLTVLDFCLVWIRGGVTWMDLICPHRRWNGLMNGTVFSIEYSLILIVVRHIIGIVGRVWVIGWNKSTCEKRMTYVIVMDSVCQYFLDRTWVMFLCWWFYGDTVKVKCLFDYFIWRHWYSGLGGS